MNIININDSAIKEVVGAGWCSCEFGREFFSESWEACRISCEQLYGKNVNWQYCSSHIPKNLYQDLVISNKIYFYVQK